MDQITFINYEPSNNINFQTFLLLSRFSIFFKWGTAFFNKPPLVFVGNFR